MKCKVKLKNGTYAEYRKFKRNLQEKETRRFRLVDKQYLKKQFQGYPKRPRIKTLAKSIYPNWKSMKSCTKIDRCIKLKAELKCSQ